MYRKVAFCILAVSSFSAVADGRFYGKAAMSSADYKIETSTTQEWTSSPNLFNVSAGMMLVSNKVLEIAYSGNLDGKVDFAFGGVEGPSEGYDLERSDWTLTYYDAGLKSFHMFLGLKMTDTAIGNAIDTEFRTKGVFVGLAVPFGSEHHRFSVSAALGSMMGEWCDNTITTCASTDFTIGLSYGGSYVYLVNPNLQIGADIKYQSYEYDFTTDLGTDVTESLAAYGLFARYVF